MVIFQVFRDSAHQAELKRYHMYFLIILLLQTLPPPPFNFSESTNHRNPSPRTGPQDLLVTHYHCEEKEQKTLHKYAINQVSQCESEPQEIETTKIVATFYSKGRATTLTVYNRIKIYSNFLREKSTLFPSLKWK